MKTPRKFPDRVVIYFPRGENWPARIGAAALFLGKNRSEWLRGLIKAATVRAEAQFAALKEAHAAVLRGEKAAHPDAPGVSTRDG